MNQKISVSEVFYSIQGEGKTMGHPAVFIRLGGCNLMCGGMGTQHDGELHNGATWRCDTIEVWMKSTSLPIDQVLPQDCHDAIFNNSISVIITGGEPLIQSDALVELIRHIKLINFNTMIEVETNGTIIPSDDLLNLVDLWNCSPKLSSSGNPRGLRYNAAALAIIGGRNSIFKFVISSPDEIDEVLKYGVPNNKIWLMPAGENQDLLNENKQMVVELCKKYGFKYSSRLHIDIWNKKTGV